MSREPRIGRFLDEEEAEYVHSFEQARAPLAGGLTPKRRSAIESMARATMADERAKISLRVSKRDLARLKSRAMQEGVRYQELINALIHLYVSD